MKFRIISTILVLVVLVGVFVLTNSSSQPTQSAPDVSIQPFSIN